MNDKNNYFFFLASFEDFDDEDDEDDDDATVDDVDEREMLSESSRGGRDVAP